MHTGPRIHLIVISLLAGILFGTGHARAVDDVEEFDELDAIFQEEYSRVGQEWRATVLQFAERYQRELRSILEATEPADSPDLTTALKQEQARVAVWVEGLLADPAALPRVANFLPHGVRVRAPEPLKPLHRQIWDEWSKAEVDANRSLIQLERRFRTILEGMVADAVGDGNQDLVQEGRRRLEALEQRSGGLPRPDRAVEPTGFEPFGAEDSTGVLAALLADASGKMRLYLNHLYANPFERAGNNPWNGIMASADVNWDGDFELAVPVSFDASRMATMMGRIVLRLETAESEGFEIRVSDSHKDYKEFLFIGKRDGADPSVLFSSYPEVSVPRFTDGELILQRRGDVLTLLANGYRMGTLYPVPTDAIRRFSLGFDRYSRVDYPLPLIMAVGAPRISTGEAVQWTVPAGTRELWLMNLSRDPNNVP